MKNNQHNSTLHEQREEALKKALEIVLNNADGCSVKELAYELNVSSDTARLYAKDLLDRGHIYMSHQIGKTRIYKIAEGGAPAVEAAKSEEPKENIMPVNHSGKEFAPGSYIPCTDQCKPGDVIWISSRSGEGAFFRYLVITPWEHKAMVLGIFEEGHPKLDINDPYYCYIGKDPEKGVNLYADLRNNCQRGYKQFGERLMHVDQDLFDDVKIRLARSMGIDRMKVKEADPDVVQLLKTKIVKLEENNKKGNETVKKLMESVDKAKYEIDSTRTLLIESNNKVEQLQKANNRQADTINELKERNADLEKAVNDLDEQLEKYEPATPAAPQQAVTFDNDLFTGMVIDSKVKETKIEMLEDQVKMLRQMVFNMIKGGGAA